MASIDALKTAERDIQRFNETLNPLGGKETGSKRPYYATGGRGFIKIGGKPIAVCQNVQWNISYSAIPIHTIDTPFAWDIDVGAVTINASLVKIYDPMKGPEVDALMSIMAGAVHQPLVELQVLYTAVQNVPTTKTEYTRNGTIDKATTKRTYKKEYVDFCMFFARGMFTAVSGNMTQGQISSLNANFTGIAYQNFVNQSFEPYGVAYIAGQTIKAAQDAVSGWTGGFL